LSFKGIDNRSYYRLIADQPRYYVNDTGTGNTLNLSHPRVIQMVADSLRYWVSEMRVDGFPSDLGTILAREPDGFKTESGFLKAVGQDPLLAEVKLIAEPWDCGPGGYQVGGFPPGWAEWNDTFRDAARDYWRGMASAKALAPRLCASPDKFNFRGRKPWASVNFIAAHDGFTLRDLVSYNDKHNEANGEENRDGHSDNRSWNCGVEGPTDDPRSTRFAGLEAGLVKEIRAKAGAPIWRRDDKTGQAYALKLTAPARRRSRLKRRRPPKERRSGARIIRSWPSIPCPNPVQTQQQPLTSQTAASPRAQRLRAAERRSRRSSNCCSAAMARHSPNLSPPPAGCRTRRGPRSRVCASAATPSGLIGPTRREDRSIGSTRRRWATIASRRTLRRRRLAKRRRIGPSGPPACELVGRRDGEAPKSERPWRGIGPASAVGVRARNDRCLGREPFRPQRRSAPPPVAYPSGRDRSRPSPGMAADARARLSDPGRGIR